MTEVPATSHDRALHWDSAYETLGMTGVSWFQLTTTTSLELIELLGTLHEADIIDIGGGASTLVDALVSQEFSNLSVLDVSAAALAATRDRLGPDSAVCLLQKDILAWRPQNKFDLWHDRAVFHFLTDADDRAKYLETLRSVLHPGGSVIMATFAADGPEYCSGLPVARYSAGDLTEFLGPDFEVIDERHEVHHTPTGAIQPFTWIAARFHGDVGDAQRRH